MIRIVPAVACLLAATASLTAQAPSTLGTPPPPPAASFPLGLPTDNDALLRGDNASFYMYVDRIFENQVSTPWEGGQYGYVRGPVRHGGEMVLMAFHEGIDIAPTKRDAAGDPTDEVRAISLVKWCTAPCSPGPATTVATWWCSTTLQTVPSSPSMPISAR
ncbi:hypothetical protein [Verrucomicrobium spinosum]|uniref:hypothetical protein n=1 Tax=Verrucomicrobium spinosum TaxID=2736 RepID=UPI000A6C2A1E|nr:hypothetical protein [Verrucomicrobium spinosum]